MFVIVAIHSKPVDADHFDDYYERVHIPLVKRLPGLVDVQYGRVDAAPDGADVPYLICNVMFPDRATCDAALASPEGADAVADVPRFATGGVELHHVDLNNAVRSASTTAN